MKIDYVTVNYGFTRNIGNYESARADVSYGASIGRDETREQVTDVLEKMCRTEVKRILDNRTRKTQKPNNYKDLY